MKLRRLSVLAPVLVGALFVLGLADTSLARPFGIQRGASDVGGLASWILAKQAEFYRMISSTIRAAKADAKSLLYECQNKTVAGSDEIFFS
jgi:hypothetical protein